MDLELTGKPCIVTGASRGIGLATARLLSAEGAAVLLVGRGEEALVEAAAKCAGPGPTATAVADVTDPDAPQRIADACEDQLGPAYALVNNAGTTEVKSIEALTDADWQRQWELHVMGPMRLMRLLAPRMAAGGGGRIVNINSSSGKRPSLNNVSYSVTKAAELSLSRAFADTYAREGVLVNSIAPGPVSTGLWMDDGALADQKAAAAGITREELLAQQYARLPSGRYGTAEEIARVIVALCSPIGDNVTGAAWSVDGGTFASIV